MKKCPRCGCLKPRNSFSMRTCGGKKYLMSPCKDCNVLRDSRKYSDRSERYKEMRRAKRTKQRARNQKRERWILEDTRNTDRKRERANDLNREYIKSLISKGCAYCGARSSKMTLDRINNTKGHLKTNVIPACVNCNLTRGNMPYKAWLIVAKAMRRVRESGLLSGWVRVRFHTKIAPFV